MCGELWQDLYPAYSQFPWQTGRTSLRWIGGSVWKSFKISQNAPPPPSQVTNDEPPKKTNRILHNLAAFYQKSIFGGINSKTKQIKTSHSNSIENIHIDYWLKYLHRFGDTVGRMALISWSTSNFKWSSSSLDSLQPMISPKIWV